MINNLAELREQLAARNYTHRDFEDGDPRKLNHLSLEQQKKRAKELLKHWQAHNNGPHSSPKLSDAQLASARQYGFAQWADLKAHIAQTRIAREALQSGHPTALDSGQRTLHIRCGTDIQYGLAISGFEGDFLCFADPYVHGPVPQTQTLDEFLKIRARYISRWGMPIEDVLPRLEKEYIALDKARDYDRVLLWFEHDSYDQLILSKLLDYFSDPCSRSGQLQLISVSHFPGVKRFNGIGQLPPEALRMLWQQFAPVTEAQLKLGQLAWHAITAPSPQALAELVDTGTPALPGMAIALRRHLFELPSIANGLSLSEQLTLQILHDNGSMNAARLFGEYTNHYEPLPFCGDVGYWDIIEGLANAGQPAVHMQKDGENPQDWRVESSALAGKLLNNDVDWLALNAIDRWVGGVHIHSAHDDSWRIDRETFKVIMK